MHLLMLYFKVGEIPLVTGGISEKIIHKNPNDEKDYKELSLKTISAPVGDRGSAVMIGKDKILFIGGQQTGTEYAASNGAIIIDISDSFNPKITKKQSMHFPRAFADATILVTIRYLAIPMAAIFGYCIWGETLTFNQILGGTLIIFSCIIITFREIKYYKT